MIKDWQDIIDKVTKQLYDGTLVPGQVSPEMIRAHSLELFDAVKLGFESVDKKNDINEYTQLRAFRENVFVFSGFKNYHQLKEMSLLLTDSDGNIRSYSEFEKDILSIDATYNKTYLKAEYNHAIRSSAMIAKWQKFIAEADIFPMIRYRTVGDERVREAHQLLDGITLPIEDVFWNTYFPPNDWNCRCDAEQVEADRKDAPKNLPTLPPMFRNNVGKDGIVFPDTHPYFNVENKEYADLIKKGANVARFSDPDENGYQLVYKNKTGNDVRISFEHNKDEVIENFELSKIVCDAKHNVQLPPHVTGSKNSGIKNLDAHIDEIKADYKTPNKFGDVTNPMKSISGAIGAANTQRCEIVVIDLSKIKPIISEYQLVQSLQGAVSFDTKAKKWHNRFIKQVWLIDGENLLEYTREDLLNYNHVKDIQKIRGTLKN